MPQGYDLQGTGRCFEESVIQMVTDAAEKNPPHSNELGMRAIAPTSGCEAISCSA